MSWSTSELRVRLAPLNRFKPSSKIFYWPFQGGTSFVDLLCFCSVLCLLCFVRVCLYVLRGHLLGKGWPLGSRLCCLLWVCHFPIGILGQVWYLIVSIPDLCNLTYLYLILIHGHDYNLIIIKWNAANSQYAFNNHTTWYYSYIRYLLSNVLLLNAVISLDYGLPNDLYKMRFVDCTFLKLNYISHIMKCLSFSADKILCYPKIIGIPIVLISSYFLFLRFNINFYLKENC